MGLKAVHWVLYAPNDQGSSENGEQHYYFVRESEEEFKSVWESRRDFNKRRNFYNIRPGSFIKHVMCEADEEFRMDNEDDLGNEASSSVDPVSNVQLKWRTYKTFQTPCYTVYRGRHMHNHYKIIRESESCFSSYDNCMQDYYQYCKSSKLSSDDHTFVQIECYEFDENF